MEEVENQAAGEDPGRRRPPRFVWLPLAFIVATLLAVVVVPIYHARQVADVERELVDVLEPARSHANRLILSQSEQMAALQAYILSGEGRFRARYRRARETESAVYDSLYALSDEMQLRVQERMVRLWSLSTRWHVGHEPVINGTMARDAYEEALAEEQRSYERVILASQDLREAIAREAERSRVRIEETWNRHIEATVGLVVLALGATAALGYLGWKMVMLFRLGERRRRDAVEARREIDAVLAATGDGVLGLDLDGKCTFLNRAGEELLGVPARRMLGRKVHELIHHSDGQGDPYPAEECPVLRSLETGQEVTAARDEVLWRPDGTSFPAQLSVRPLVDGRDVGGAVLTFTDLTEIRKTEKALRKAVRARDEVVAVVSHDLRNPLSTVSSATELLLELEGLPEEKRNEHLRGISRAAKRMGRLIEDLLDVASIEAGALSVEVDPVRPEVLIGDAEEVAAHVVAGDAITVRRDVRDGLPPVLADRDRILQVFSNLVSNAARFTPEGGRIVLGAILKGGEVIFEVRDSGPGIPDDSKGNVFDRFWKVNRLDRDGAGLGLAIVQGIVEAHGGRVWVEDAPEGGARFRFTLSTATEHGSGLGRDRGRDVEWPGRSRAAGISP